MKVTILLLLVATTAAFDQQPERTWTAIGDSITYLNDHPNETGNRVTKGYLTRVTDRIPHLRYINQGHNGWTSWQIAARIDSLGIQRSDIYSIFLGTNDWWQGYPLGTLHDYLANTGYGTTFGSFRIIINKIRSLNPHAKIILITPMQRTDFVYIGDSHNNAFGSYRPKNGQHLGQFAAAVVAIAKHERLPVIDLYHAAGMELPHLVHFKRVKDTTTNTYQNMRYPAYTRMPFNPDTDEYPYPPAAIDVTYDGLHPSDKGNEMIATRLLPVFKRLDYATAKASAK